MARTPDVSPYKSFDQIADRLDEIIVQVRDKDTSLERSLDLFDEAIALGQKAVDFVDTDAVTGEEALRVEQNSQGQARESEA